MKEQTLDLLQDGWNIREMVDTLVFVLEVLTASNTTLTFMGM
jgi:hypothetical protein